MPNIENIDVRQTATNPALVSYLTGRGWGSYGPLWKRMPRIWRGALSDAEIQSWWKTGWLIDGMQALRGVYSQQGSWYPLSQETRVVGGVRFRSSARGVLFTKEYGSEVHVINPRKSQWINTTEPGFLARAAYEEFAINDPNNPSIAVLDLGSVKKSKERRVKMFRREQVDMMPVEQFEYVMNSFFDALKIADPAAFSVAASIKASDFRIGT